MTRANPGLGHRRPFPLRRFARSGFSLVEVVIATGLCTYALVVIACLLPMGLGTVQTANAQIVETEIFNKVWLEVNSTPFSYLPSYFRFKGGYTPGSTIPPISTWTANSGTATGTTYFDKDGDELTSATGAVYYVYCALVYPTATNLPSSVSSNVVPRLSSLGPPVDGLGVEGNLPASTASGGAGLALVLVQIGFHIDPNPTVNPTLPSTDTRLTNRTFVIAKRDTING